MLVFTADIHGGWKKLYESLPKGTTTVFICGDAEPIRFEEDLELIPAPKKTPKAGKFSHFLEERRSSRNNLSSFRKSRTISVSFGI